MNWSSKKLFAVLGVCALVLLRSSAAHAQSDTPPPNGDLKLPVMVWGGAVASDWISTYRFSTEYRDLLHETNPLIRTLDTHPGWMVTVGASIDAATGWAAYRLLGRNHPRVMKAVFYGAAAYRAYLMAYNIQMMREAQAIRTATIVPGVPR